MVVGHRADEIVSGLEGTGIEPVFNSRYQEGMLTSVQCGVAAAPADTDWLVIALGDQPELDPGVLRTLLVEAEREGADAAGARILVPSHAGRRGHPLLIHKTLRPEIGALDPEVGLRGLMQRYPETIRHVLMATDTVLLDLDTPEDYRRALDRAATQQT